MPESGGPRFCPGTNYARPAIQEITPQPVVQLISAPVVVGEEGCLHAAELGVQLPHVGHLPAAADVDCLEVCRSLLRVEVALVRAGGCCTGALLVAAAPLVVAAALLQAAALLVAVLAAAALVVAAAARASAASARASAASAPSFAAWYPASARPAASPRAASAPPRTSAPSAPEAAPSTPQRGRAPQRSGGPSCRAGCRAACCNPCNWPRARAGLAPSPACSSCTSWQTPTPSQRRDARKE